MFSESITIHSQIDSKPALIIISSNKNSPNLFSFWRNSPWPMLLDPLPYREMAYPDYPDRIVLWQRFGLTVQESTCRYPNQYPLRMFGFLYSTCQIKGLQTKEFFKLRVHKTIWWQHGISIMNHWLDMVVVVLIQMTKLPTILIW